MTTRPAAKSRSNYRFLAKEFGERLGAPRKTVPFRASKPIGRVRTAAKTVRRTLFDGHLDTDVPSGAIS